MFSAPQTLENVLKELFIQLQDRENRLFHTYTEDTCIRRLVVSYQKKPRCPCTALPVGTMFLCTVGSPASSAGCTLLGFFQLLASSDLEDEKFAPMYQVWRFLRIPSVAMLSLVLTGLIMLSQRGEMVSRVQSRGAMLAATGWGSG